MKNLCERKGIMFEQTGRDTPQRNGKIERRFATDTQRATASLISANIETSERKKLWTEFVKTQSDISNIICTKRNPTPPHTKIYKKDSKLPYHVIELGRVGYLAKLGKIKPKKSIADKATSKVMCGYAPNHSRDTYRL